MKGETITLHTQTHTEDQYPISAKALYFLSIFLHELRILSSSEQEESFVIQFNKVHKYTTTEMFGRLQCHGIWKC